MSVPTLPPAWGITVVRLMAGIVIFVASLEKFFGGGFDGFTRVTTGLGIPMAPFWGVFIPLLECVGGALLIVGLLTRWTAALFIIEFLVTSVLLKAPRQPPFGGWDSMRIDLMLLAAAVALVLVGPGALALETYVRERLLGKPAANRAAAAGAGG
jgi:putative oxidoreductase